MKTAEIEEIIDKSGLISVLVSEGIDENKSGVIWIDGDLNYFLERCKQLGAAAIYLETTYLTDAFFLAPSSGQGLYDDPSEFDPDDSVDLTTLSSDLKAFKKRIGDVLAVNLMCKVEGMELHFRVSSDWEDDFFDAHITATDQLKLQRQQIREKIEAEFAREEEVKDAEEDRILNALDALLKDPTFCSLTSRGQMKEYAMEEYPETTGIDAKVLDWKVEELSNKLKVKKKRKATQK